MLLAREVRLRPGLPLVLLSFQATKQPEAGVVREGPAERARRRLRSCTARTALDADLAEDRRPGRASIKTYQQTKQVKWLNRGIMHPTVISADNSPALAPTAPVPSLDPVGSNGFHVLDGQL